jgi:hypothetical protein
MSDVVKGVYACDFGVILSFRVVLRGAKSVFDAPVVLREARGRWHWEARLGGGLLVLNSSRKGHYC